VGVPGKEREVECFQYTHCLLVSLEKMAAWEDGESVATIRGRLTPEQLAAPGTLLLRISERGGRPWVIRGLVLQEGMVLGEVMNRLPATLTHEEVMAGIEALRERGYLQGIRVTTEPHQGGNSSDGDEGESEA
jgi:hypothetical protein